MSSQSDVTVFLAKSDIHNEWIRVYRTKENEAFFTNAFNKIIKQCNINNKTKILDAGCGSANHAIRLAKKGFNITAVDFSEPVLEIAREKTSELKLADKIEFKQGDITNLSFEDNSFDVVYCWGVLMHIADIEQAIKELCRVVKPNGFVVLSEANKNSLEALTRRAIFKILKKKSYTEYSTKRGLENWYDKKDSKFLVRIANIKWLRKTFHENNAVLTHRFSGQFTELYRSFKVSFIRKIIHSFNKIWFNIIRSPGLAFGNILIFKKIDDSRKPEQ